MGKSIFQNGKIIPIRQLEESLKLNLAIEPAQSHELATKKQIDFLRDCHAILQLEVPESELRAMTKAQANEAIKALWTEIEAGGDDMLRELDDVVPLSGRGRQFIDRRLSHREEN